MEFFYRLLGIAARINESASRLRVNFIPVNLAMMLVLGFGSFLTGVGAIVEAGETGPPRSVRLVDVLAHRGTERRFVRMAGNLDPTVSLQARSGDGDEDAVTKTWVPLVDGSGKRGILVELHGTSPVTDAGRTVELIGRLESLDTDLLAKLQEKKGKVGGIKIDTDLALVEGSQPVNPFVLALLSLLTGIPAALLFITAAKQYVVFRKVPLLPGAPVGELPDKIDLRMTGRFVLDGRNGRRFLDVPSVSGPSETGELLFVSNIDASSRFFGITTSNQKGYWVIAVQPGSLQAPEPGVLYLGTAARPALRLRYRPASGGPVETAVASFGSEVERFAFLQRLHQG